MSLKINTPCDDGICPFNATYNCDCQYWCGAEEPQDNPEVWDDDEDEYDYDDNEDEEDYDLEMGFDPYMGCYTEDC